MPSFQYWKSHCGDKTILRPSYLHNGISCIGIFILNQGPGCIQYEDAMLPALVIPIIKTIRSWDHLIFIIEFPILGKTVFIHWNRPLQYMPQQNPSKFPEIGHSLAPFQYKNIWDPMKDCLIFIMSSGNFHTDEMSLYWSSPKHNLV